MPVVSEEELTRRREEILEGARRCFATYGYEGATVRRLEEATGKSRGAIFHHFKDKETLFLAIAREDAAQQAQVVKESGLVEVMRDMLRHPEQYEWQATRLEISRMLRTDPNFKYRWEQEQEILDAAIRERLETNEELRTDEPVEVVQIFLETVMDGFITRLASGKSVEYLDEVLDVVEGAVRG